MLKQYDANPDFSPLNVQSHFLVNNKLDRSYEPMFLKLASQYSPGAKLDNYITLMLKHAMLEELEVLASDINTNLRKNLAKPDGSIENEI
jgi:hypothetical protein